MSNKGFRGIEEWRNRCMEEKMNKEIAEQVRDDMMSANLNKTCHRAFIARSNNKLDCFVANAPRNDGQSKPLNVKNYSLFTIHHSLKNVKNLVPSKKAAFTLAEVLITLGVIGVVAAMTMPAVITRHQKNVTVNKLKKAYSELSQALKLAEAEHGTLETWDFADFANSHDRSTYFFDNYLSKNINVIEKCVPPTNKCWADEVYLINGSQETHFLQNSPNHYGDLSFITSSGYSVYGWLHGTGNGAWFFVDINGTKKPNIVGKDIFPFLASWGTNVLYENYKPGLFPYGLGYKTCDVTKDKLKSGVLECLDSTYYNRSGCSKEVTNSVAGWLCTALIMYDGWKIEKDYPW